MQGALVVFCAILGWVFVGDVWAAIVPSPDPERRGSMTRSGFEGCPKRVAQSTADRATPRRVMRTERPEWTNILRMPMPFMACGARVGQICRAALASFHEGPMLARHCDLWAASCSECGAFLIARQSDSSPAPRGCGTRLMTCQEALDQMEGASKLPREFWKHVHMLQLPVQSVQAPRRRARSASALARCGAKVAFGRGGYRRAALRPRVPQSEFSGLFAHQLRLALSRLDAADDAAAVGLALVSVVRAAGELCPVVFPPVLKFACNA